MKRNDELIAEQLRTDPEFCAEWERTVLARAVAVAIVRYRSEHDLSHRELAERLRMKQPQVVRLELGEVNPNSTRSCGSPRRSASSSRSTCCQRELRLGMSRSGRRPTMLSARSGPTRRNSSSWLVRNRSSDPHVLPQRRPRRRRDRLVLAAPELPANAKEVLGRGRRRAQHARFWRGGGPATVRARALHPCAGTGLRGYASVPAVGSV